jgi:hypothetical protein
LQVITQDAKITSPRRQPSSRGYPGTGAETSARAMTIIETAKLNGLDPLAAKFVRLKAQPNGFSAGGKRLDGIQPSMRRCEPNVL